MSSITISGGGSHVVRFGDDNNSVYATHNVKIFGGDGDNSLDLLKGGRVSLGDGNNAVTMGGSGHGHGQLHLGSGNDTITLGLGTYRITEEGTGMVSLPNGQATVSGGTAIFSSNGNSTSQFMRTGDATLQAGSGVTRLIGGSGDVTMLGGSGPTTMVGGSGQDSMVGGSGADVFRFDAGHRGGGPDIVDHFVQGQDKLSVENLSFSYLQSHNAISESGGNTYISLGGGNTTIEIHGVTGLTAADFTRH